MVIPISLLHRSKNIWGEDADKFDPDNFLPERIRSRPKAAFIPYSIGPRDCIGIKYANIMVRSYICWLVRNYRFTTSLQFEDLQYQLSITLRLANGVTLQVHKRDT